MEPAKCCHEPNTASVKDCAVCDDRQRSRDSSEPIIETLHQDQNERDDDDCFEDIELNDHIPETSSTSLSRDENDVEEQNPRLSRYDMWQQELCEFELPANMYREDDDIPPFVSGDKQIDRPDDVGSNFEAALRNTEFVPTSVHLTVNVEKDSPSQSPFSPNHKSLSTDARVERSHPKVTWVASPIDSPRNLSSLEYELQQTDSIDIVEGRDLQGLQSPQSPHEVTFPGSPIYNSSLPVDEGIVEQILENSIKCARNLLSKGPNQRSLAVSQEIGRLMGKLLVSNGENPTVSCDRRSLSDMLDGSAWRGG